MKERAEEIAERKGLGDRELKRGRGGIRDIEFAVQLLQLVHGRHDPAVRSPTTLDALHELADGGYVDAPTTPTASTTPTGSCAPSSTGSSSTTSSRPTRSRPTHARESASPACSATATSPERTALERFEAEHRAHQAHGALDPRAAVLRAAARDARGHRPAVAGGGRRSA